jgi:hypothetical protein
MTGELSSRKQVLNPEKIIPETPGVESPDVFAAMGTTFKTSGDHLDSALIATLLAACGTNLILVCAENLNSGVVVVKSAKDGV